MALAVKDLIDAGVHFGHRASRWNPKMKPYIYGKRNLIHIIDLKETVRGLLRATKFFQRVAANHGLVLFVGTKRQAADSIIEACRRSSMPYVTERWLGGTLTNFRTIRSRLTRFEELEALRGDAMKYDAYSKKMQSALNREYRKMFRNLNGIRTMNRLPECLVIIDPKKEKNAVSEAQKMGVASVALIDTDCDPDLVDLPIPGNDDSMRSIEMVVKILADAIAAGKQQQAVQSQRANEGAEVPVQTGRAVPIDHRLPEHLADFERFRHQHRRLVRAAHALEVPVGIESRRCRLGEPSEERPAVAAIADVGADVAGLGAIEDDEIPAVGILERLRGGGARLLVLHLAVNHRGEAVLRVADDVLPHVEHGAAGRIDQRAALIREAGHVSDGDAKGGQDDDILAAECRPALSRIAQKSNASSPEPMVHMRVVDDLAGQKHRPVGEPLPRLIRIVHGAIDAVAEPELVREVNGETA